MRMFYFEFSNGEKRCMQKKEAEKYAQDNDFTILLDTSTRDTYKTMVRDGFKAGYCPGTGQVFGGPREKAKYLNRNGLEEMGREKRKIEDLKTDYFTDTDIKEIVDCGADLSGEAINHLKKEGPIAFQDIIEEPIPDHLP